MNEKEEILETIFTMFQTQDPSAYFVRGNNYFVAFGETVPFSLQKTGHGYSFSIWYWNEPVKSNTAEELINQVREALKPHINRRRLRHLLKTKGPSY